VVTRLIESRIRRSKKSLMLLGARQVGKSTLMRSLGPDVVINLADEALYLGYAKDPERLKRELAALRKTSLVLIDEVQRVPALLNTVQAVLDEGATHRFLLTGSSARKLKRGGANLLPGRIVLEHLDPLTIWELGDAFDLERALCVGMLPGVYLDADEGDAVLETYASVYLREEIQAEAVLRDIGSYARFLDTAAATNGDWVNYAKLASDSEIAKETLRRYYQVLEDTLIAFRLPSFSPAASTRRVTQRERILLFDIGVRNALVGQHRHAPSPTQRGHLFEQWLILQCLAYARALRLPWKRRSGPRHRHRPRAHRHRVQSRPPGDTLATLGAALARRGCAPATAQVDRLHRRQRTALRRRLRGDPLPAAPARTAARARSAHKLSWRAAKRGEPAGAIDVALA